MDYMSGTLFILLGLLVGMGLGILLRRYWLERQTGRVRGQAQDLMAEARKEAETKVKEARAEAIRKKAIVAETPAPAEAEAEAPATEEQA